MQEAKKIDHCVKRLADMKPGQNGVIVSFNTDDADRLRKFSAFGIFPGVEVNVIQKYPAYVIQIGYTQVAIDTSIACEILVRVDAKN